MRSNSYPYGCINEAIPDFTLTTLFAQPHQIDINYFNYFVLKISEKFELFTRFFLYIMVIQLSMYLSAQSMLKDSHSCMLRRKKDMDKESPFSSHLLPTDQVVMKSEGFN